MDATSLTKKKEPINLGEVFENERLLLEAIEQAQQNLKNHYEQGGCKLIKAIATERSTGNLFVDDVIVALGKITKSEYENILAVTQKMTAGTEILLMYPYFSMFELSDPPRPRLAEPDSRGFIFGILSGDPVRVKKLPKGGIEVTVPFTYCIASQCQYGNPLEDGIHEGSVKITDENHSGSPGLFLLHRLIGTKFNEGSSEDPLHAIGAEDCERLANNHRIYLRTARLQLQKRAEKKAVDAEKQVSQPSLV